MDLIPYLATVILVATVATILLALFSYWAFKWREPRQPVLEESVDEFFTRYYLPPPSARQYLDE